MSDLSFKLCHRKDASCHAVELSPAMLLILVMTVRQLDSSSDADDNDDDVSIVDDDDDGGDSRPHINLVPKFTI